MACISHAEHSYALSCSDQVRDHVCYMQGDHNRATSSHNLNAQSSRSHAIFSLWCRVTQMGASLPTFPLT